jgi:hypothetical protein
MPRSHACGFVFIGTPQIDIIIIIIGSTYTEVQCVQLSLLYYINTRNCQNETEED